MQQRTVNWRGFILICLILLATFLIIHAILKSQYASRMEYETELNRIVTGLEQQNRELEEKLRYAGTDNYIVTSAINDYSFVNKNDIRFEFTNPEALDAYTMEELQIRAVEMMD